MFKAKLAMFEILAQRGADSPMNKWLNENPLVLGIGALVLGAVLALSGFVNLKTGTSRDKWGTEHTGGIATFTGLVRLIAGIGVAGFGVYKMIFG